MLKNEYMENWWENRNVMGDAYRRGAYRACDAYMGSVEKGAEILTVSDIIWEDEIADFVSTLKSAGIDEFAVVCRCTGNIDTFVGLEANGCMLMGLTAVVYRKEHNRIENGFKFRVVG